MTLALLPEEASVFLRSIPCPVRVKLTSASPVSETLIAAVYVAVHVAASPSSEPDLLVFMSTSKISTSFVIRRSTSLNIPVFLNISWHSR